MRFLADAWLAIKRAEGYPGPPVVSRRGSGGTADRLAQTPQHDPLRDPERPREDPRHVAPGALPGLTLGAAEELDRAPERDRVHGLARRAAQVEHPIDPEALARTLGEVEQERGRGAHDLGIDRIGIRA